MSHEPVCGAPLPPRCVCGFGAIGLARLSETLRRRSAPPRSSLCVPQNRRFGLFSAFLLTFLLTFIACATRPAFARVPQDAPATDLPCLLSPQARGVIVLFSGKPEELALNFTQPDGSAPTWQITNEGFLLAQDADIMTKRGFDDFQLHVEFKIPQADGAAGQERGKSAIVMHGRFEMQILDSFGVSLPGQEDCGAVLNAEAPLVNACKAPQEWQSYDIIFRTARFSDDGKSRLQTFAVTAFLNGSLVQNNTEIQKPTGSYRIGEPQKPTPFLLQYHGSPVAFRNIWILPLSKTAITVPEPAAAPLASAAPAQDQEVYNWQDVPQGEQVAVQRVFFDGGGYQVVCNTGETIVVPFANDNPYAMKFGRSGSDSAYFVNDGTAPVVYLSNNGYLENPAVQDSKWYPLSRGYSYTAPVYVGLAPSMNAYSNMAWYPNMEVHGGLIGGSGGAGRSSYTWMPGYYTSIDGSVFPSYNAYLAYITRHRGYTRNRVIYPHYGVRPTDAWRRRKVRKVPPRAVVRPTRPVTTPTRPGGGGGAFPPTIGSGGFGGAGGGGGSIQPFSPPANTRRSANNRPPVTTRPQTNPRPPVNSRPPVNPRRPANRPPVVGGGKKK